MTTTYKVTSQFFNGSAFAMYDNGMLDTLIVELSDDAPGCKQTDYDQFPLKEKDLLISYGKWQAIELKPKTVAEKVALFCLLYKKHKGIAYRATKQEKANMKLVTCNQQLLDKYFTSTAYPLTHTKTMADYVRHYNTVRDLATNGTPAKKSSFPDVPDSDYEKTLSIEKLNAYRQHLLGLGWRKRDGVWIQEKK